ncbi:hypothetical protein ACQEV2_42755 [Streptomyces sp. CA-251387]|uniref:hypothetical protein n=1 Tax=Streptomyces sp. CA-251387 TaxID=3240064 RepID=UPI003D911EB4
MPVPRWFRSRGHGCGLRTRKKAYPVLAALSALGPARAQLRAVMVADDRLRDEDRARSDDEDLAQVGDLVAEAGGYQQAAREARRLVQGSLAALDNGRFHT